MTTPQIHRVTPSVDPTLEKGFIHVRDYQWVLDKGTLLPANFK
jgi:hypothetical protein